MADVSAADERAAAKDDTKPKWILIFSGKRKSGKDFITDELHKRLGSEKSIIIKLSGPIKSHWAKIKNLDSEQLFGDGKYKESYRLEMVKWSENLRNQDYGYFCRAAVAMYNAINQDVWIISDARRRTDLKWFYENYGEKCKTIRITCSDEVRKNRGWIFTKGIDDSETECDLDGTHDWDLEINNSGDDIDLIIQELYGILK